MTKRWEEGEKKGGIFSSSLTRLPPHPCSPTIHQSSSMPVVNEIMVSSVTVATDWRMTCRGAMLSVSVTSPQEERDKGHAHIHTQFVWPWLRRCTRTDFPFRLLQEKIATIAGRFDSDNRCQNTHSGFSLTIRCFQTRGNPSESILPVIPRTRSLCECTC